MPNSSSPNTFHRSGGYGDLPEIAPLYDDIYGTLDRGDIEFHIARAVESGGPVLELGCGTGRILIPTAREGIEVTGLDLAQSMLDVCRGKLEREEEAVRKRVNLHCADMIDFDFGRTFSLVTTPFRSFHHVMTVDDQLSCLRCIHRHLRDDGRLILDMFNPHMPFLVDESRRIGFVRDKEQHLADGRRLSVAVRDSKVDTTNQMILNETVYTVMHPDGHRDNIHHCFEVRYTFRWELEHLLARCGFVVEQVLADFDGTPFGEKDPSEMITICRKG